MSALPRGPLFDWSYLALLMVLAGSGCGEVFGDPIISAAGGNGGGGKGGSGGASLLCSWASAGSVKTVAAAPELDDPHGVAVDENCNIYVADRGSSRILRIDPQGAVSVFAGSGTSGMVDGPAATAQFNKPRAVALDPTNGDLIVADTFNHSIRRISGSVVSTVAGTGKFGFEDGPVESAMFSSVSGIAVDFNGDIYVADPKNERIRLISGGQVSTHAGSGQAGSADGPALNASFNQPEGLAITDDGSVLVVADTKNHLIRKISGGQVSTAGTGEAGYVEGNPTQAQFDSPWHIVMRSPSLAYVADSGNAVVRRITSDGTSLLAGVPMTIGDNDGPLSSARFASPRGLAVGPGGEIVIGDANNNAVRVLLP